MHEYLTSEGSPIKYNNHTPPKRSGFNNKHSHQIKINGVKEPHGTENSLDRFLKNKAEDVKIINYIDIKEFQIEDISPVRKYVDKKTAH